MAITPIPVERSPYIGDAQRLMDRLQDEIGPVLLCGDSTDEQVVSLLLVVIYRLWDRIEKLEAGGV